MNTIVMNTLTGAVSEYDGFVFQSITPTHAGSATGLFLLGGDLDLTATIDASFTSAKVLISKHMKTAVDCVFIGTKGSGDASFTLSGETVGYTYEFAMLANGVSRVRPGRGFRENYVSFGVSNLNGADMHIDSVELIPAVSTHRRTH